MYSLKLKINNNKLKRQFTIVEITVAMLVLAILLTVTMQFVGTAQSGWSAATNKNSVFENARVALGLINRQIQGIYYKNNVVPFFHKGSDYSNTDADSVVYNNDSLSFVAYLNDPPNDHCTSTACEVQYQLYYNNPDSGDVADTAGWLLLSVTGNKNRTGTNNDKWNFYDYVRNNYDVFTSGGTGTPITAVFSDNDWSKDSYIKLIPYVTDLSFICYNEDGTVLEDDEADSQVLPSSIEITLSLLDKNSWSKWITLDANGNKNNSATTGNESAAAVKFRQKKEHTFKRTIYIGNRSH